MSASPKQPHVLAVVGSGEGGNTYTLVDEVLEGARREGARTTAVALGRGAYDGERTWEEINRGGSFDALVLGTPMYRGTFRGALKDFLDDVPRARPEEGFTSPLLGKVVAVVGTGASAHHYLGIDPLVSLLARFFSAYVVPPALYGRASQVNGSVDPPLRDAAHALGAATAALATAVTVDPRLADQRPQF